MFVSSRKLRNKNESTNVKIVTIISATLDIGLSPNWYPKITCFINPKIKSPFTPNKISQSQICLKRCLSANNILLSIVKLFFYNGRSNNYCQRPRLAAVLAFISACRQLGPGLIFSWSYNNRPIELRPPEPKVKNGLPMIALESASIAANLMLVAVLLCHIFVAYVLLCKLSNKSYLQI